MVKWALYIIFLISCFRLISHWTGQTSLVDCPVGCNPRLFLGEIDDYSRLKRIKLRILSRILQFNIVHTVIENLKVAYNMLHILWSMRGSYSRIVWGISFQNGKSRLFIKHRESYKIVSSINFIVDTGDSFFSFFK